jgi:predicted metal-dependent hydrolase
VIVALHICNNSMLKYEESNSIQDIEFKIKYSARRTLAISILPDSSVIVRVPYRTSLKTIHRLVQQKSGWITKHLDNFKGLEENKLNRQYINGESHLFRGNESVLKIEKSARAYVRFNDNLIELGLEKTDDPTAVKSLLYNGYKNEASLIFPEILKSVLKKHEVQSFIPKGIIIRTMKRRWGSCSNKGIITLSTELIKLPDLFIEYVIVHELCHLKHHNHGSGYYKLLSELFPEWKLVRKEMKRYIP